MDTKRYIRILLFENVIALAFYMFCPGVFREIGGVGKPVSFFVLLVFVFVAGAAGTYFTEPENRNGMSVARNTVFPFGLYTVLSCYAENAAVILTIALIVAVLSLLYLAEATPRREEGEMKLPTKDIPVAVGVWTIINLGLATLMLTVVFEGLYEVLQQMADKT